MKLNGLFRDALFLTAGLILAVTLTLVSCREQNSTSAEELGLDQQNLKKSYEITVKGPTCLRIGTETPKHTCAAAAADPAKYGDKTCFLEKGTKLSVQGLFAASPGRGSYWYFLSAQSLEPPPNQVAKNLCTLDWIQQKLAQSPADRKSIMTAWIFSDHFSASPGTPPLVPSKDDHTTVARGIFTSGYGWRWGRMHQGIDIANKIGTPIYAICDGVVDSAGWNDGGYGNLVGIKHDPKTCAGHDSSLYAHNQRIAVEKGQRVTKGQKVAEMGSTGRSTGPHLHFEITVWGKQVDPLKSLASLWAFAKNRLRELFSRSAIPLTGFLKLSGTNEAEPYLLSSSLPDDQIFPLLRQLSGTPSDQALEAAIASAVTGPAGAEAPSDLALTNSDRTSKNTFPFYLLDGGRLEFNLENW